jgi:hypothetical protein
MIRNEDLTVAMISEAVYLSNKSERNKKFLEVGYSVKEDCIIDADPTKSKFQPQYIISLNQEANTLCISFKGTEMFNIEDWFANCFFMPFSLEEHRFQVHAGYWSLVKEYCHEIFTTMNLILEKYSRVFRVVFTGHSKGGACRFNSSILDLQSSYNQNFFDFESEKIGFQHCDFWLSSGFFCGQW